MEYSKKNNMIMTIQNNKVLRRIIFCIIIFIMSIFIGLKNFLLYHTIVALVSSIIRLMLTIIAINTYKMSEDSKLIFLGISLGFVACFDLIHMFTYKGIGIFADDTGNISTQMWIVSRYIESISFLIFVLMKNKRFNVKKVSLVYFIVSAFILVAIFRYRIFPDIYIGGSGFTAFKKISGFIISGILLCSILIFNSNNHFKLQDKDLLITLSLTATLISEGFFIYYNSVHSLTMILGHIFKVFSSYFIYIALVMTSLEGPQQALIEMNVVLNQRNKSLNSLIRELKLEYLKKEKMAIENQKRNEILETILESSLDGIVLIGNNKRIIKANTRFLRMLNIEFNQGFKDLNRDALKAMGACIKDFHKFESSVIANWNSRETHIYNIEFYDGRLFKVFSLPFIKTGVVNGRIIRYRDITEEKKMEELQTQIEIRQALLEKAKEVDELKNNFFCTISHEFKTPLSIILGIIQLINDQHKYDSNCKFLSSTEKYREVIKQNCYRLIKIADNLIDITKIDSGFMKIHYTNRDIVHIIEDITLSTAEYTYAKNLSLTFDTEIEEKIMACDPDKLERIMLNLLSNAIKFTDPGGKIEVVLKEKNDKIVISVKDTGIGIPDNMNEIIFDRFRQVDTSLRRAKEGSGIGLALVKSIVESLNGKVYFNSEIGKGSEFIIELPIFLVENDNQDVVLLDTKSKVEKIKIEFSDIYELQ